ncbi:hypothetical protein FHS17_002390 [Paenibacillus lupini]|nr:hypothetical protein [Paenibacillus lupini]
MKYLPVPEGTVICYTLFSVYHLVNMPLIIKY